MEKKAFEGLVAIRGIKKAQIEGFFAERIGDVTVLADNPFIKQAFKDLDLALHADGGALGGKFRGHT
ncbi:MAG: hypothetical protein HQ517_02690, partial [SAR324 cluster bacterium]|nr:hypothetical protein [SAR324 cluster bacterium]